MGENGAGKSTMIKALTGVYKINAGSIMVDGKIMAMGTPDELKRQLNQPDMDHVFTFLARQSTRQ